MKDQVKEIAAQVWHVTQHDMSISASAEDKMLQSLLDLNYQQGAIQNYLTSNYQIS